MAFAILFNNQRSSRLIIPRFALAIASILWILEGDQGLNLTTMVVNVGDNPLSYGLALSGVLI
jgi:hypothetical protein